MYTVKANVSWLEGDVSRTAPVKILWNGCVLPKVPSSRGKFGGEKCLLWSI